MPAGVTIDNPIVLNSDDTRLEVATGTAKPAGVISSNGGVRPLEKIGGGTLILTGNNSLYRPDHDQRRRVGARHGGTARHTVRAAVAIASLPAPSRS